MFLSFFNAPQLDGYLWLIPLYTFSNGIFLALNYWSSRTRRYSKLSIARVISSIITTGVQLGAGLSGYANGIYLIGGNVLGILASILMIGGQTYRGDYGLFKQSVKFHSMIMLIKKYKNFPLFDMWSALITSLSWQLPTFILSSFFSSKVVGYYALGMIVLQSPLSLIDGALSQVFFQRAAKARSEGTLNELVETIVVRLVQLGLFPILVLSLIGKDVFIAIFGANWAEAGIYTQILSIWIILNFISSPISTLFSVLEKQSVSLLYALIIIPLRAASLVIGCLTGDPRIALMFFSFTQAISTAIVFFWLINSVGITVYKMLRKIIMIFLCYIPFLSVILVFKLFLGFANEQMLLLSIFLSIIYYVMVVSNITRS
jgi:O-antigen/teichoic acid export membrane protein